MKLKIDPTLINSSPQEAQALGAYLIQNDLVFLEKKGEHKATPSLELEITHNLILDQENQNSNIKRYYVISKDFLGKGAFSKARGAMGYIDVDITSGNVSYTPNDDKAIRVKNTQYAQKKRQNTGATPYSHSEAVADYQQTRNFSHIGMQHPIEVKKSHAQLGLFSKSYAIMNKLKGRDLDVEIDDFIGYADPDTATMVKRVLLPILEAYKTQISDKNFVHRDIKLENIRAYLAVSGSTINFLDVDSALKLGANDTAYGSPGFLPPELSQITSSNTIPVTQARDIFQLGVLLIACLNPNLNPNAYFPNELNAQSGNEVVQLALEQIQQNGCYDPDKMGHDLFEYIQDSLIIAPSEETDLRNEIKAILKEMTNGDPAIRPDIDTVISKFNDILVKLEPQQPGIVI
ncbi:protein kinase [Legionella sainthelensi]|uniref:Serine/threonine protein kinase n=1 Tax=Legionella sainthelensi TaxID=28087 RepID=A0A2H5FLW5_9GAMM|nr:serine/threonine protein kinase [Legionella sainthelensi]AUH72548.1 serine/threonine protein kinase [Legionella sainthelensi]VEB35304.1 protein kinase [Legionella sainthelensi]